MLLRRPTLVPVLAVALVLAGGATLSGCADDGSPAGPATRSPQSDATTVAPTPDGAAVERSLSTLEQQYDATVGVVATDTGTGASVSYRPDQRFGYASTLKAFAAAEFLRSVPAGARDERVRWTAADVAAAGYSPVTEQHVDDGLPLVELAEAAVRRSDNTALNLVLQRIGGPAGLDAALGRLGDSTTEVVHDEPDLNTIEPGSIEDTTTPRAFTADLVAVLAEPDRERGGDPALGERDRATLLDWMRGNATGDTLVRAGAPDGWTVADKSGGAGGIRNDVAWVTRPDGAPIALTVLTTRNTAGAAYDDALVAKTAAAVLAAFDTAR